MDSPSNWQVDYCDLAPYAGARLPTIDEGILLVDSLSEDLRSYDLFYEQILEEVKKSVTSTPSGVYAPDGKPTVDNYHRSSEAVNVDSALYDRVADRLDFVVNYHLGKIGPFKRCESLQFLRYDESNCGHFSRHTDSAYWHYSEFRYTSPMRKLSTITYLNDDYEGGELVLDTVKQSGKHFRSKMAPGTTIIFPSDLRFPHEVVPVTKGTRYSIVAWYDYN